MSAERNARTRAECGQASIELLALAPLLLIVAFAAAQVLAALACREYAAHGAHAGAVALLQGGDPVQAARAALPGWSRSDVHAWCGRSAPRDP